MIGKVTQIIHILIIIALSACNIQSDQIQDGRINDYHSLIKEFKDPGIEFRPAPLWVWNNDVSKMLIQI